MPVTGSNNAGTEKGPGGGGRTTFRPPWVKEGATQSTPAATNKAPWVKKADTASTASKENGQPAIKEVKLQSREIKVPIMTTKPKPVQPPLKPKEERRDSAISVEKEPVVETKKEFLIEKPKLRHVEAAPKESGKPRNELPEQPKLRPVLKKTPKVEEKEKPFERKLSSAADRIIPAPPPPPPPSNGPPPPPPPPSLAPPENFEKKPLSEKQKHVLDKLKQRPRRRPDWSEMMKEVEDGKKLRHVQCNDRSQPILTCKSMTKVSGQFVYETEKANVHNQLLKQIQFGISLKPTKCNDRSKPFLEGLRKFRRQMTIEEQIQKSESRAVLNEEPVESEDEMDDIDKLRDDLQSTKQMLALELRNKEAQERENKLLLAKIANLDAELEREKSKTKSESNATTTTTSSSSADEALVNSLKRDAEEARKTCKDLEKKYQQSAEQLDAARAEIEEHKRLVANLEKKLAQGFSHSNSRRSQIGFCFSYEDSNDSDIYYYEQGSNDSRRPSEAPQKDSSPEPELDVSESESDEDEEKKAERIARRLAREVKMLVTKLSKLKDKQQVAQKERSNLKEAMKKNQVLLKEETKRFKKLQKEVDKMAKMLNNVEDDDEDAEEKDEDEEEEEEEEEETESEEDSESEESEEESGSETESESEDEDAEDEYKKANLEPRVKKHEGRLNALKKGNYLLQTNVDRLLDEVNKMREQSASLQRDLDSVLSELG